MRSRWSRPVGVVLAALAGLGLGPACSSPPNRTQVVGGGAHSVLDERHGHGTIDDIRMPTAAGSVPVAVNYDRTRHGAPWVLYVHGGYWRAGTGLGNLVWAERERVRGFQVFSVDYRLSQQAHWPGPLDDVESTIAFIRSQAVEYGLDPQRGVVVGFSAGGQLGTIAGLDTGVAGIVDLDGAVDPLAALAATNRALGRAAEQLLGCRPQVCPRHWQDVRAVSHIRPDSPPILIVHSVHDPTVPIGESLDLAAALRRAGRPVQLFEVLGKRHQSIGVPAVAKRVDEFLDAVTARPAAA